MLKTLRNTAIHAANSSAVAAVLSVLDKVDVARQGVLSVVTYHRIDEADREPQLYPGLISATPSQFAQQLDLLADIGEVVSMRQVLEAYRGKTTLPPRSILITFDDACRDFAAFAWPALQARQMPVTLFVPTAYPDRPERQFWWDRLYTAVWHGHGTHIDAPSGRIELASDQQRSRIFRTLRDHVKQLSHAAAMQFVEQIMHQRQATSPPPSVMGWNQLRKLAREGVTLAAHTRTHPLLTRVSSERARQEIVGSRDDLRREIGDSLPVFAYPGGASNSTVLSIMKQAGYELAFSVRRGVNDLQRADPLTLNRINVGQNTTPQILRAQLIAGWWRHRAAAPTKKHTCTPG